MQKRVKRIAALILIFISFQVFPQNTIVFGKEEGLTSHAVTVTFVDSRGIVWVGTNDGLNAIVGNKLTDVSQIQDNESKKFKPLNKVNIIYEDREGYVWVGTDKGLFMYNRKFWTDYEYFEQEDYVITRILEDRRGWMWFTHEKSQDMQAELGFTIASGTVQLFDRKYWYMFDVEASGSAHSRSRKLTHYYTDFLQDRKGNIWLSSLDGLRVFNDTGWNDIDFDDIGAEECYDLLEDKSGVLWLATKNGITSYKNGKWTKYEKESGLKAETYNLQSEQGDNLWSFQRNENKFIGLCNFNGDIWEQFKSSDLHIKGSVDKLIGRDSVVIAFSRYDVSVYQNGKWTNQDAAHGLMDKRYNFLMKDRKNNIWLGGDNSFYEFINGQWNKLYSSGTGWEVLELFVDRKGNIWIGTSNKGVMWYNHHEWKIIDANNGLPDNYVSEIFEDRKGHIWLVTRKGVVKLSE